MASARRKEKVNCKRCNKEFYPLYASVGCYCSHSCSVGKGREHSRWVGDEITYQDIHSWLRNKKKDECDFCGISERLELAFKKGNKHERRIENYYTLCIKCHRQYDSHEAWNKGLRTKENKMCEYCKEEFYPPRKESRFCSNHCSQKSRW